MTETESELLELILTEWSRLTLMSPVQRPGEGWLDFRHRIKPLADLETLGIAIDPAWIGSSPAQRQARSRALTSLEQSGWIIRTARRRGFRPSHVRVTDDAITAILAATTPQPPPPPKPTPLTTEEADVRDAATAAELDALLAADRIAVDKLLADITESEPLE